MKQDKTILHVIPHRRILTSTPVLNLSQGPVCYIHCWHQQIINQDAHRDAEHKKYSDIVEYIKEAATCGEVDQNIMLFQFHRVLVPYPSCSLVKCITLKININDAIILRDHYC